MTWTLNAVGHISSEDNTEEAERKLAQVLAQAIQELPDEDVHAAQFVGNHVQCDLRKLEL